MPLDLKTDKFISIHALLAESDVYQYGAGGLTDISIHALLAESDAFNAPSSSSYSDFYPRSPCGERPYRAAQDMGIKLFLSTLSLRRATEYEYERDSKTGISIHALLAESDVMSYVIDHQAQLFLSTLSLRRATSALEGVGISAYISIHALLAESDGLIKGGQRNA
mgnify:CR=1 FL=1